MAEAGSGDPFRTILGELSDGKQWELIRAEGWQDFAERLSHVIAELPVRRRQAVVMLLFALSERIVSPTDAGRWMAEHDVDTDEGVEQMISWLREQHPNR